MNECKSFFPISNVGVGFLFGANNTFSSARVVVVSSGFKKGRKLHAWRRLRKSTGREKLTGSHMCMHNLFSFFLPKTAKKCNSDVHLVYLG